MAASSNEKGIDPKRRNNKYVNPWNEWPISFIKGVGKMIKWVYTLNTTDFDLTNVKHDLPIHKPVFTPNLPVEGLKAFWLGHASVFVEIDGYKVLCDPVFGPEGTQWFVGPRRYVAAPCAVEDFNGIDIVLISHNHYDHMDYSTLSVIHKKFPLAEWVVPIGDASKLMSLGIRNVTELSWWDSKDFVNDNRKIVIKFTPTQHWSNRGVLDSFKSLWGSWAIIGKKHKFWFGGDTGYCPGFKEIGKILGPFDMAAIPIGAYEPREMMAFQHVSPEEAVEIHKDIGSKYSFGIHWGTFQLTTEPYLEPKTRLVEAVAKANELSEVKADDSKKVHFCAIHHGQSVNLTPDGKYEVEPNIPNVNSSPVD